VIIAIAFRILVTTIAISTSASPLLLLNIQGISIRITMAEMMRDATTHIFITILRTANIVVAWV
jgi:hypothetical protein